MKRKTDAEAKPEVEVEATQEAEKKASKKPKKTQRQFGRGLLYCLQHVALTVGALLVLYIVMKSVLWLETDFGVEPHYLFMDEPGTAYEDSQLFQDILRDDISELLVFGAIRHEMETDGQFDGNKIIDIVPYLNRYGALPNEYITTQYYLDDLLKWSRSGFAYNDEWLTKEKAESLLNEYSKLTVIENGQEKMVAQGPAATVSGNMMIPGEGTADYFVIRQKGYQEIAQEFDVLGRQEYRQYEDENSDKKYQQYLVSRAPFFEWGIDISGDDDTIRVELLYERYQTIWGDGIGDYVSSWAEYQELRENVEEAANYLFTDYERYRRDLSRFDTANSNIRYCIQKTGATGTEVYTNLSFTGKSVSEIEKAFFDQCERYIEYQPAEMKYEATVGVREEFIREGLVNYPEAYPDDVRIWIGVDKEYPAMDALSYGKLAYSDYVPYLMPFVMAAIACFLIYLVLLAVLTRLTGRAADADGNRYIRLSGEDHIPTEIMLALVAAIGVGVVIVLSEIALIIPEVIDDYPNMILSVSGSGILLGSLVFSFFYYSFVRRLKARSIWRDSLLKKIIGLIRSLVVKLVASVKRTVEYVHDNTSLLVRVMLPLMGLVLLHGILLIIGDQLMYYSERFIVYLIIVAVDLLVGAAIYKSAEARCIIVAGIKKISGGDLKHKVDEKKLYGDNLVLAQAVNSIGDSISNAVDISMKDERMKADLITNVSHDIKTPLTSIISYVDLIKRENIDNDKLKTYIEVLDNKSQRLKQLTDDLVEASKISSGNITLNLEHIDLTELVNQTIGEFTEKFASRRLTVNSRTPGHNLLIEADSRRIWRVMENLFNNVSKYAMEGTRVYIDLQEIPTGQVMLTVKNISQQPLNISAEELTERFIRGDVARSTEGSGLGLSIAKNLTEAQNGYFEITMDGDLFKVTLIFPILSQT